MIEEKNYKEEMDALLKSNASALTFNTNKSGDIVDITVLSVNDTYAIVDFNSNADGFVLLKSEESYVKDALVKGVTYKGMILETDNVHYDTIISISAYNKYQLFKELYDTIGNNEFAYTGKVLSLVDNAGYIVEVNGLKAFMPGSLASMNLLSDFSELIGKEIPVMVVNYTKENNTLIVSHKEYLKQLIPHEISNLDVGDEIIGYVTGVSKYGVFVGFNTCLTGMIHITNLDEVTKDKYTKKTIKVGSEITCKIKDVSSGNKINLTQNNYKDPWVTASEKFLVNKTYKGKVTKIKEYGAFIRLADGISGLLTRKFNNLNVGELIDVKIKEVDAKGRKIYFS